ncbi:HAD family hydrolase [Candidatus Bathyarchaeota archaeon]|nr:MAG: HAD family hydrolase [Candidatus Bathyarchaeota archaeon]
MIRGILFDYGNTLVRVRDGATVLKEVLADLGHEIDAGDALKGMEAFTQHWHKHYSGLPRGERWTEKIRLDCDKAILQAIGLSRDQDALAREVAQRWDLCERQGPYEDVKPTLEILEKMGLKLGVLSQNPMTGRQLNDDLKTRLIATFFSVVLTSEDAGYDKPDPRFFEIGCKMIKLKNTELWYVGNRYHEDVVGARNAGITPVLVERGRRHRPRDCLAVTGLLSLPSLLKE